MQEAGVLATHGMVQHLLLAVGKSGKSEDMLKVVFILDKLVRLCFICLGFQHWNTCIALETYSECRQILAIMREMCVFGKQTSQGIGKVQLIYLVNKEEKYRQSPYVKTAL